MMPGLGVLLASFLGASVEWVEAFTIVLAVALSIGWRGALGAGAAALAVLAAMTLAGTALLSFLPDVRVAQGVIGVLLMLFGLRWLAKAIARGAGLKALHDELAEFEAVRAAIQDRRAAWWIAFNGTMMEGLEVWLMVVALGGPGHHLLGAGVAALAALGLVLVAGAALRKPLALVPENAVKFLVGGMILAFGTFWTLEALGYDWPGGEFALPVLAAFYLAGAYALMRTLRVPTGA